MNRGESQNRDRRALARIVPHVFLVMSVVMSLVMHVARVAFTIAVAGLLLGSPRVAHTSPSSTDDAAEEPAIATQTWYAQTRVATNFGVVTTHYWSKGALFRAETILAGHPVITIVNGPRYYIYDPVLNKGAAIERNAASVREDRKRGRPFGREHDEIVAAGGEKVHDGPALDEGAPYEIYQLTNENGRRRVLVTLSDPPLPFRVETFVRKSGANGTLEYSGWQRGLEIDDSFFQPPAAVHLVQVSYRDYTLRAGKEPIGPAPVYYRDLLHGQREAND